MPIQNSPEATAAAVRDGWLYSGDMVSEENGQLRIVDRLKDVMITAGGRNLTPPESARGNAGLASVSQIRRFHLLEKELDHDDGEVTATMKVRRASVYKACSKEIEAMYGPPPSVSNAKGR